MKQVSGHGELQTALVHHDVGLPTVSPRQAGPITACRSREE